MSEIELKLLLLRYNILSRERVKIADMCAHTCDYGKWADCIAEMKKMEDDLRKHGYEFAHAGFKTVDELQYSVYKIVLTNDYGFVNNA